MKKLVGILFCNIYLFAMVDINHASVSELKTLNGVGAKKAQRIQSYIKENGCFTNMAQLSKIKGISQKIILKNKENIKIISCQ